MIVLEVFCMVVAILTAGLLIYNYQKVCAQLEHYKMCENQRIREAANQFTAVKNRKEKLFSWLWIKGEI